ncbi:MAG: exopolysaccharide biosynthesis polyprenyl glycosylphosphotransferase [Campylobacterales bacterium]|nr:exopolysaccharide biosynthesis polyprenyl glycosylphosphotransferase [Campylobacterales bacterium]MBN2832930.1 exopolysaccharide biosynthesis polyprenyl glycosylphosphotransferase [Campylobacterales bacterium]
MRYFLLKFFISFIFLVINLFLAIWFADFLFNLEGVNTFLHYSWMISVYMLGYFSLRLMTNRMVTVNAITLSLKANFFAFALILIIIAIAKLNDTTSRAIVCIFYMLNNFNALWSHYLKKIFFKFKFFRQPVFVICDDKGLANIHSWFAQGNPFGYDVKEIINVSLLSIEKVNSAIDRAIEDRQYDSAVIDLESNTLLNLNSLVNHIQRRVRKVIVLPKMSKIPVITGELISSIHHKGMAFYIKNNLLSPVDQYLKRGFDIVVSLVALFMASPFLIWLYSIVYVSTKGHPIFSHDRIGFGGKKFKVYKFRTMFIDADERLEELLETCEESKEEWERDFKLKNDPRITKIGHFLRRTSLDELPQLVNVLKGEMSLVGPRPIVEKEIEKYGEYFEYFTAVTPGITGLWQVSGRNDIEYDERVQLDVWYVRNWSIELDVQILIKTVLVVLGRKGSY